MFLKVELLESDLNNDFYNILTAIKKNMYILNDIQRYDITDKTILAICLHESLMDKNYVSKKGAIGLTGIMPITAKQHKYKKEEMFDIEKNISCCISHLKWISIQNNNKKEILLKYFWGNKKIKNEKYYLKIIEKEKMIKNF